MAQTGRDAAGIATPFVWSLANGSGKPIPARNATGGPADSLAALDRDDGGLILRWADGTEQRHTDRDLRLACQCAQCRDEVTSARLLDPESVPLDLSITRIWSIGNYALGIAFSDGHDTGIYTFKALRAMTGVELEDV
ncbi:MAG: DUF971 domain-containing protein [Rhodobacteraceae bacterium]|nr:DUF971 domain-containing protein [Paracoccaceae bacterium]